jgi:hypothetical protein
VYQNTDHILGKTILILLVYDMDVNIQACGIQLSAG